MDARREDENDVRILDEYVEYLAQWVKTDEEWRWGVDEYMTMYSHVYRACTKPGVFSDLDKFHGLYVQYMATYCPTMSDAQYAKFTIYVARLFNYVDLSIPPPQSLASTAASIREDFVKRRAAAAVIARALWRRVQRRQQMELLDELYRPGGLGALRAQQRFEAHQAAEDTL